MNNNEIPNKAAKILCSAIVDMEEEGLSKSTIVSSLVAASIALLKEMGHTEQMCHALLETHCRHLFLTPSSPIDIS